MESYSKLISSYEAADFLGVTKETLAVWRSTKRYDLPYVKMGRSVKYKVEHLESFINSRTQTGGNSHA